MCSARKEIEMDFFGKLGESISDKSKIAMDKAKELTEIARLKSQISTCQEVIKTNYLEIGKLYYEKYGAAPEQDFAKACGAIENAKVGQGELQKKIQELHKS